MESGLSIDAPKLVVEWEGENARFAHRYLFDRLAAVLSDPADPESDHARLADLLARSSKEPERTRAWQQLLVNVVLLVPDDGQPWWETGRPNRTL